jgi:hypothetical protein
LNPRRDTSPNVIGFCIVARAHSVHLTSWIHLLNPTSMKGPTMKIQESLHSKMKVSHIKYGDARVFGEDSDVRKKLSDEECAARFTDLWNESLSTEVETAQIITREEAEEMLETKFRPYAVIGFEYRQFSLYHVPFIARITPGGYCDQLWALGVHRDNTRLCVHFGTIRERERFEEIAKQYGWEPRDLGLSLMLDFMKKIDRFGDPKKKS